MIRWCIRLSKANLPSLMFSLHQASADGRVASSLLRATRIQSGRLSSRSLLLLLTRVFSLSLWGRWPSVASLLNFYLVVFKSFKALLHVTLCVHSGDGLFGEFF